MVIRSRSDQGSCGGVRTSQRATTSPYATQSGGETITAVGGHGGLDDLERLTQGGDLKHVEATPEEQVGELDGLLLQRGLPEGARLNRRRDHGLEGGIDAKRP